MTTLLPRPSWNPVIHAGILVTFLGLPSIFNPILDVATVIPLFITHSLSSPLILLSLLFFPLIIIASSAIYTNALHPRLFTILTLILTITLLITFSTTSILYFYIFFEFSLIPTSLLILFWGYQPERVIATIYLLLYIIAFSLPLLFSISYFYSANNTFSFPFSFASLTLPSTYHLILTLSFLIALLVKLPIFFTHLWLPKAHVEAPVAGSIILAGILLKLGAYGLLQFIPFTPLITSPIPSILVPLALLGALIARIICLQQTDIKSLIAYASVRHIGLLLAAVIIGTPSGYNAALLIRLAHGLASSALFRLANYTYIITGTRNLFLIKGLITFTPILTFWWFLFLALNLGAPPSLNFIRELLLILSIIPSSLSLSPIIFLIITLSAAYSLLLYTTLNHGSPSSFLTPSAPFPPLTHLILLLHFLPLLLLILTPHLILWTY